MTNKKIEITRRKVLFLGTETPDPLSHPVLVSKKSDNVAMWIDLKLEDLSEYCTVDYAADVIWAAINCDLHSLYLTPKGKIKAIMY